MRVIAIFILSLILFPIGSDDGPSPEKHLVTVNHPAFGKDDPREFYLWEHRPDSSSLEGYFLDVESVICVDHSCKIVPVRLFWDPMGNYRKFELAEGVILEKGEGKPFLPEDYDRLHEIMTDKSSPYKELSYYEITHEKVHGEGEVDAVTGATAIILDESQTIVGGAWTCYTLWHWANGEIVQEIQRITGTATSPEGLQSHLESEVSFRQLFALKELIRRRDYTFDLVEMVVKQASGESSEPLFFKNTVTYLEQTQSETFYRSLKTLLEASPQERRIQLWNTILRYENAAPKGYFDSFWDKLLETSDYQELDLFLTILDQKGASTAVLNGQMIPLLEEAYSIFNRRIYWFLSEQELSESQNQVVKSYYEKNYENL